MDRAASPATWILANGFSCREQIEQATGRETLHIAEVAARRLVRRFRFEVPKQACRKCRRNFKSAAPGA